MVDSILSKERYRAEPLRKLETYNKENGQSFERWVRANIIVSVAALEAVILADQREANEFDMALSAGQHLALSFRNQMEAKSTSFFGPAGEYAETKLKKAQQAWDEYHADLDALGDEVPYSLLLVEQFQPAGLSVESMVADLEKVLDRVNELQNLMTPKLERPYFLCTRLRQHLYHHRMPMTALLATEDNEARLQRMRYEIRGLIDAYNVQIRILSEPELEPSADGQIPDRSLGIEFARGWLMREWQYVSGMIKQLGQSKPTDQWGPPQVSAYSYAATTVSAMEMRIVGGSTHEDLQASYDRLLQLTENFSKVWFALPEGKDDAAPAL